MITYKLKINYQDSKILQSNIEFVSGDIGAYQLECEFYDRGKRVDISNYSVTLKAKRADGVILSEGGKVAENKGVISLNNDIYAVPGELYLEIALVGSAKNYITAKIILANVLEGLGETDETAGNASSVYVTLLEQVKAKIDSANSVLNEAKQVKTEMEETLAEYAKKEDIEEKLGKKIGIWQPNTEYKTGDFVFVALSEIFIGNETAWHILECLNDHTSSDVKNPLQEENFSSLWYIDFIYVLGAYEDGEGNIINKTYATKEEVNETVSNIQNEIDNCATKEELGNAEAIAKGRATGYVFDTLDDMNTWLADESNVSNLVLGDNLYIRATDVPDYWWDGNAPQQLETQKVDLSEYCTKEELETKVDVTAFDEMMSTKADKEGGYELIEKIIVGYSITTSEPEDWETNYTSYFKNTGTLREPVYTALTEFEEWVSGMYFDRSEDDVCDVRRLIEPDGSNVSYKSICFYSPNMQSTASAWLRVCLYNQSGYTYANQIMTEAFAGAINTTAKVFCFTITPSGNNPKDGVINTGFMKNGDSYSAYIGRTQRNNSNPAEIKSWIFQTTSETTPIKTDVELYIYGVRV